MVERQAKKVSLTMPDLAKKRVSPHTIRVQPRLTCCAQGSTSIRFLLGSGTISIEEDRICGTSVAD
jgi:hypothetical protein